MQRMTRGPRTAVRLLGGETGVGLVEVMVAALLLVVGALALLGVFNSASKATVSVNRQEVAINQGERQLEWLRTVAYDRLWMASVPAPGSGDADPFSRISGTGSGARYLVGGDSSKPEELVVGGSSSGGWTGIATGPTTFTAGTGGQQITGKTYTFISWRDEECPLVNVSGAGGLKQSMDRIGTAMDTNLQALYDNLNGIILPPAAVNTLKNNLQGSSGLIDRVNDVEADLDAFMASGPYSNLVNGGLDLCDLDVGGLRAVKNIRAIESELLKIQNHNADVNSIARQLVGLTCSLLPVLCNSLGVESGQFNTDVPSIRDALDDLEADLATLSSSLAAPNTTHNTKRVTVAVTVDTSRSDVAPVKPIWLSTVITDPQAGLL